MSKWSSHTYRLDELDSRNLIPCVVYLMEGYYPDTDADGFSQGDVVGIDRKMTLHKVAAQFTKSNRIRIPDENKDYVELSEEILVPLNYKGKLKVTTPIKKYSVVRELAYDGPRYATVLKNFKVTTENKEDVTIQAGTVIELDRTLPGVNAEDKLVIAFEHLGTRIFAAIPVSTHGQFRSQQDDNEYTIREAIDRYSLPQIVSFVDDHIKKVYTQDLLEGIENMHTITETLQLNRLVTQEVLVGHYKPQEVSGASSDSEYFRKRTLIVLPLDQPDIREIEVHVLEQDGDIEDLYEEVFLVRNVTHDLELIDGLYVEFAMKPGVKILDAENKSGALQCDSTSPQGSRADTPPPRPPRRQQPGEPPTRQGKDKPVPKNERKVSPTRPVKTSKPVTNANIDADTEDYIIPGPVSPPTRPIKASKPVTNAEDYIYPDPGSHVVPAARAPVQSGAAQSSSGGFMSLADAYSQPMPPLPTKGEAKVERKNSKPTLFKKWKPFSSGSKHEKGHAPRSKPSSAGPEEQNDDPLEIYDQVNYETMLPGFQPHIPGKNTSTSPKGPRSKSPQQQVVRPINHIPPTSRPGVTGGGVSKYFYQLSSQELVERLTKCQLVHLAGVCERERLDGSFFRNISDTELKKDFKLSHFDILKFHKIRDDNWVPNS